MNYLMTKKTKYLSMYLLNALGFIKCKIDLNDSKAYSIQMC